ncbi:MAG: sugar phosphate isomerase/epimerase [Planctomycetota bacterium]|nr:sugar phosphate isomerase/epimerase [Planctomycetota bacterium]MDA1158664.1 sugar phosphate isomerase/epimerase [Planctomycetota bacterium]
MTESQIPRRSFLLAAGCGLASVSLAGIEGSAAESAAGNSICVFTKPFNSLTFDELADRIAELGFDGVEAPIRSGGHIEPAAVPDELPRFVEALRKRNLELTVMTSDINDPNDPLTEKVLKTASELGVRRYRMKYFKYDFNQPILKQLDEWRPRFKDLAAMNRQFGVTALYQNHAGRNYLGAPLWDLRQILDGIAVNEIGVAYDIRHATVEAGMSWPVTYHMIRPHIETVYVKDFVWNGARPKNVPLGEGNVSAEFFQMLKKSDFNGPVSLHEEYLDHRKPELVPEHLAAIRDDLAKLRKWLG